jgi:hypothetical protein
MAVSSGLLPKSNSSVGPVFFIHFQEAPSGIENPVRPEDDKSPLPPFKKGGFDKAVTPSPPFLKGDLGGFVLAVPLFKPIIS